MVLARIVLVLLVVVLVLVVVLGWRESSTGTGTRTIEEMALPVFLGGFLLGNVPKHREIGVYE